MFRAAATVVLAGLVSVPVAAAQGRYGSQGIPPGQMPPPGMCRVWYDGRPPGRQPRATNCDEAERIASRSRNARVIYGERRGDIWDRSRNYPYPDRYPNQYPYPDRYPNQYPYPDRSPYPDRNGRGYGYDRIPYQNGYQDGLEKGREDGRDRDGYNPAHHSRYKSADRGYNSSYGSKDSYRAAYRDGFLQGYEQGYYQTYQGSSRGTRSRGIW
jgi:hypothetical protein